MVIIQQRDITLNLVKRDRIIKSSGDMGILINYQKTTVCHSQSQAMPQLETQEMGKTGPTFNKGQKSKCTSS